MHSKVTDVCIARNNSFKIMPAGNLMFFNRNICRISLSFLTKSLIIFGIYPLWWAFFHFVISWYQFVASLMQLFDSAKRLFKVFSEFNSKLIEHHAQKLATNYFFTSIWQFFSLYSWYQKNTFLYQLCTLKETNTSYMWMNDAFKSFAVFFVIWMSLLVVPYKRNINNYTFLEVYCVFIWGNRLLLI